MPIYINGQKYTGGYQNGHRINLYYEGLKAFSYATTVTLNFYDNTGMLVGSQQIKPVPLTEFTLEQLMLQYNVSFPFDYELQDNDDEYTDYQITPNDTINVNVQLITTTVSIEYVDDHLNDNDVGNQTLNNVPLGLHSFSDLEGCNAQIPNHYDYNQGSIYDEDFNVNYNSSFTVHVASEWGWENIYVYLPKTTGGYDQIGPQTINGWYGQQFQMGDISLLNSFSNLGFQWPYNPSIQDGDASFITGAGSNPQPQPQPTPQPQPQPSGPSSVTCNVELDISGNPIGEYYNVTFTPDNGSFNVTEAEIFYYINNTNKHWSNGKWATGIDNPSDYTAYFHAFDYKNNPVYVWDPHWNEHNMGTDKVDSNSIEYIGDKYVDLEPYNGQTIKFNMTYNWDHSWSKAMELYGQLHSMRI